MLNEIRRLERRNQLRRDADALLSRLQAAQMWKSAAAMDDLRKQLAAADSQYIVMDTGTDPRSEWRPLN